VALFIKSIRGNMDQQETLIIIGSGPSGYTAAIYAARANMHPLVFEGFFSGPAGGQLMTTTEVENYPGFPEGVSGPELMRLFREQALRFGARMLTEDVVSVDLSTYPFVVKGQKHSAMAKALVISTGATAKRLDIPGAGEEGFWQKGVTACAVCDGAMPIFRNKSLFVIGGGDSAIEEAVFLTKFGSDINIIHRRNKFRASKIMQERALSHPKIKVHWDSVISEILGDNVVREVIIKNVKSGGETKYPAGGVFFAIGHTPNTAFLNGQLAIHDNGYINVVPGTCQTSVEGVFAAGDVQDHVYRQAITAAGSGCMASIEAERWLSSRK
jgi:thioredoxin reductase (NADPH)